MSHIYSLPLPPSLSPGERGGWAQMRYQRHIKDHMDKHHQEVAEQLTELFDSGKWKWVEKNDVMEEHEGACASLRYRSSR